MTYKGKNIIQTIIGTLKKKIQEIRFRAKLREMDDLWYFMGGNCFGLFPPSFYHTHTLEEIERITAETMEQLRAMIDELE